MVEVVKTEKREPGAPLILPVIINRAIYNWDFLRLPHVLYPRHPRVHGHMGQRKLHNERLAYPFAWL